jgi:hypothetical protein
MVQLQLPKYTAIIAANTDRSLRRQQQQQRALCREIVETIRNHYNGRFLVERTSNNSDDDDEKDDGSENNGTKQHVYYYALTSEQAIDAVKAIFQNEQKILSKEQSSGGLIGSVQQQQRSSVVKKQVIEQLHSIPKTLVAATINDNSNNDKSAADVHKMAIQSLQQRKKRQTTNTKISNLVMASRRSGMGGRSQSAGVGAALLAPSLLHQAPPQPRPAAAERYATTGMMQDYRHNDDDDNQEWMVDRPRRRMTTRLSDFSQGMIKDLLVQLEADDDDDDSRRREYPV